MPIADTSIGETRCQGSFAETFFARYRVAPHIANHIYLNMINLAGFISALLSISMVVQMTNQVRLLRRLRYRVRDETMCLSQR